MRQEAPTYHKSLKDAHLRGKSLLGVSLKTHCIFERDKNLHELCMDKFQDLMFFILTNGIFFFEIQRNAIYFLLRQLTLPLVSCGFVYDLAQWIRSNVNPVQELTITTKIV